MTAYGAGMDELVAWLREQLDEDERPARAALTAGAYSQWDCPTTGVVQTAGGDLDGLVQARPSIADHIARWDPSRVLAEVEAKRARIDILAAEADRAWLPGLTSRLLMLEAQPFSDRPGFKDEWRLT